MVENVRIVKIVYTYYISSLNKRILHALKIGNASNEYSYHAK